MKTTGHKLLFAMMLIPFAANIVEAADLHDWGRRIDNISVRFTILPALDNDAVLDNETQLVWERHPEEREMNWVDALAYCRNKAIGKRLGWRLPSMNELSTLQLQPGAGFAGAFDIFDIYVYAWFWTATSVADAPSSINNQHKSVEHAYGVGTQPIGSGFLTSYPSHKTEKYPAWCVRGASSRDTY